MKNTQKFEMGLNLVNPVYNTPCFREVENPPITTYKWESDFHELNEGVKVKAVLSIDDHTRLKLFFNKPKVQLIFLPENGYIKNHPENPIMETDNDIALYVASELGMMNQDTHLGHSEFKDGIHKNSGTEFKAGYQDILNSMLEGMIGNNTSTRALAKNILSNARHIPSDYSKQMVDPAVSGEEQSKLYQKLIKQEKALFHKYRTAAVRRL